RGGAVPYRDFRFEYPPAALPAMLLPSYMSWSYATSFAVLMGVCGAGCIAAAASALRAVDAGAERTLVAVGALAAVVRERPVVSGMLLGLGFAAKLWPAVLLPIAIVHLWRRRGP